MMLIVGTLTAQAQNKAYKGITNIVPIELRQEGEELFLKMKFDANELKVDSRRSVDFTPVLITPERKLELPSVQIKGRNNYKASRRSVKLMSKREASAYYRNQPNSIIKGYGRSYDKFADYNYTIPFEPWMSQARLEIKETTVGCGNIRNINTLHGFSNVELEKIIPIEPYIIKAQVAYVQPKAEAVKNRAVEAESFLDFAVSKTDIRPDFGNNRAELNKIDQLVGDLTSSEGLIINGISITGYASPEGSLELNKRLSEGRARALQDYLITRYDIPRKHYSVIFGGEDWDGLARLVTASDMRYKYDVLDIIENVSIEKGRETKIMKLAGGEPYRYMLAQMFPRLRRVVLKADYEVRDFSLSEAVQIIKRRPQDLSLNEMYLVANTYQRGSNDFNEVFETAVRMFPNDQTANQNAAAAAISRQDFVSAEKYLSKVNVKGSSAEYNNNMGVLMMLKGDYTKAESMLKTAIQEGSAEAKSNLKELTTKLENIKQIELQKK